MFIITDILQNIIGPMLDLKSMINLHLTCKDIKLLFEDNILEQKYYLNGNRYKNLEEIGKEYLNIPDMNKRPNMFRPSGTACWTRIDNTILNIFNFIPINIIMPNYNDSDKIIEKWFDFVKEGDIFIDDNYSHNKLTYFTIIEKSKYTKTQILTENGIREISPLYRILIPPRTDILI